MKNNWIRNRAKSIQYSYFDIRTRVLGRSLPESVYFYTFHKCASTLFSKYVLKNIDGLHHIDYASQIYTGYRDTKKKLAFRERGFIYGPIRISAFEIGPTGRALVKPTTDHGFIQDKIALFFVRDPRDIMVSRYYSFGFNHGLSKVDEIRKLQKDARKMIRAMTLDEYVLQEADNQINLFRKLYDLSDSCERSQILRYEDMINDFDTFSEQLLRYVSLSEDVLQLCYDQSRPKVTEDITSHRRSGQVQGFRDKLKEDTIETLNRKLADTLTLFGYPV